MICWILCKYLGQRVWIICTHNNHVCADELRADWERKPVKRQRDWNYLDYIFHSKLSNKQNIYYLLVPSLLVALLQMEPK